MRIPGWIPERIAIDTERIRKSIPDWTASDPEWITLLDSGLNS
jgi:hypothetical protein